MPKLPVRNPTTILKVVKKNSRQDRSQGHLPFVIVAVRGEGFWLKAYLRVKFVDIPQGFSMESPGGATPPTLFGPSFAALPLKWGHERRPPVPEGRFRPMPSNRPVPLYENFPVVFPVPSKTRNEGLT